MKNNAFLNKFKYKDKKRLQKYFNELDKIIHLNKKDKAKLVNDYENYILYCVSQNENIKSILERIAIDKKDGKNKNSYEWFSLDNSSKIYPLSMKEDWMSIYRLSFYLKENVCKVVLQMALNNTIMRFPVFRTSIHKGFFWNYLDVIDKRFEVIEEKNIPCSSINIAKHKTQAFRLIYYKRRISCEFFHVLSDADGGMVFLTTLVNEYLRLLGREVDYNKYALNVYNDINKEEIEDAFLKQQTKTKQGGLIEKKALQIDGKLSLVRPCQIIHFDLDLEKIHCLAREKDVTINELLLTFLFVVLSYSTSKEGDIKIQVPVNMRKFYPSRTLRNFSLYNTISLSKKEIKNFDEVIKLVKEESRKKLNKGSLDGVMYHAIKLVKSISVIPLFVKRPITKFIYRYFGDKGSTTVLSNLGKIELPLKMMKYVEKADFVLGTTLANRLLFSVVTINNIVTLTISKFTTNTSVENNLYSLLKEYDLIVQVHGSDKYEIRK